MLGGCKIEIFLNNVLGGCKIEIFRIMCYKDEKYFLFLNIALGGWEIEIFLNNALGGWKIKNFGSKGFFWAC